MSHFLLSLLLSAQLVNGDPDVPIFVDLNGLAYHINSGAHQPDPLNYNYDWNAINGFGLGYRFNKILQLSVNFTRTDAYVNTVGPLSGESSNTSGYRIAMVGSITTNPMRRLTVGAGAGAFIERSRVYGYYFTDYGPGTYNINHYRHYEGVMGTVDMTYRILKHFRLVWEAHLLSGRLSTKPVDTDQGGNPLYWSFRHWTTYLNPIGKLGLRISL